MGLFLFFNFFFLPSSLLPVPFSSPSLIGSLTNVADTCSQMCMSPYRTRRAVLFVDAFNEHD